MRNGILGNLILSALVAFSTVAPAEDVKHVVFISVDGLAASYFDDPKAELPTLRMLAKQGVRAEGMITTFPSVTWPSHTSLITGTKAAKHGVIGNSVFDRRAGRELVYIGDPELEKADAIKVPTLYDVAHAAGLKCGSVIWPCCNGAKSLDWVATGQGYSFNGELTGDVIGPVTSTYKGTHGHLPQPAYMHATFVAAGKGIRTGVKLKTVNNTDVAPTIARLMGLTLDGVDGRVLREILKD